MCDSGAGVVKRRLSNTYGRADNCDVPLPLAPPLEVPRCGHGSLVCAALAGFALANGPSSVAHAADPKAKTRRRGDDLAEDKTGIGKTLQWEDKVMGPDDKKSELDKIRRAQEINKAAAEKAEREKAANAAREAKEKEAAAKAGPTTQKRGGEVALPTLPDEGPSKGKVKAKTRTSRRSSRPTPRSAAARAEAGRRQVHRQAAEGRVGRARRSEASATDDKALRRHARVGEAEQAGVGKKGKKDGVDDLLSDADKAAPMPETQGQARDARVGEAGDSRVGARAGADRGAEAGEARRRHHPRRPGRGRLDAVGQRASRGRHDDHDADPGAAAGAGVRKQTAAVNSKPANGPTRSRSVAARQGWQAGRRASAWSRTTRTSRPRAAQEHGGRPRSGEARVGRATGTIRSTAAAASRPARAARRPAGRAEQAGQGARASRRRRQVGRPVHVRRSAGQVKAGGAPVVATREPAAKHESKKFAATPTATHKAAAAEEPAGKTPAQGRWGSPEEAPLAPSRSHRFRRRAAECGFFYVRRSRWSIPGHLVLMINFDREGEAGVAVQALDSIGGRVV